MIRASFASIRLLGLVFALVLGIVAADVRAQAAGCQALCIDDYVGSNRSFWNAGSSGLGNYTFSTERGGQFVLDHANGTARIMGELVSVNHPNRRFDVDITLTGCLVPGDAAYPPSGSPKIEGPTSIYDVNGGPIDTTIWTYWTGLTGTLRGQGYWEGAIVDVTRRGPAAQFGMGGNVKDAELGISSWINMNTTQQPTNGNSLPAAWVGDINASVGRQCVAEPFPGSTDDLELRLSLDGDAPRRGFGASVNEGRPGQNINVTIESPDGTFAGDSLIVGLNCFMTCAAFPEFYPVPWDRIYMTPIDGANVELFGPAGLLGTAQLDDDGSFSFSAPVYPIFEGMSLIMQAFVISPSANDGFLAITNALRFDIIPPALSPPAPQNVQASVHNATSVDLSWDPVVMNPEGIKSYRVYVNDEMRAEVQAGTSVTLQGLAEQTLQTIQVMAVSALDYESPKSATTSVTTPADTTPPTVMSASAIDATTIEVVFDEDVDPLSATDVANYGLDQGGSVSVASLDLNGRRVLLTVSAMSPNLNYMLTLEAVEDMALAHNAIPANTQIPVLDARVTEGLVALYAIDEGTGSTLNDSSGVGAPLNLTIADPSRVSWQNGGLSVNQSTIIASAGPATKIATACQATNEISIEAWVHAANITQTGPARIATMSNGTGNRNFTLGQAAGDYLVRLRTTDSTNNGMPNLGAAGSAAVAMKHVVFTRSASGNWRLWVDGVEAASGTRTGTCSNWNPSWTFALANETSMNRAWLGELHLVAIYDRALDSIEIQRNLHAGL